MKPHAKVAQTTKKPRRLLEQKIRLLVRHYRAAERSRQERPLKWTPMLKFPRIRALALTIALLAIVAFSFATYAASTSPSSDDANTAFAGGNYRAAAGQYEAILAREGYSAPVLFNLGNAEYRTGDFGAAILNYERAQVLAPRDPAIAANLRLAREKAGVQSPAPSAVESAACFLSPNTLAWIGSFALAAICVTIASSRFLPRFSQGKAVIGVAAIMLLAVASAFAIRWPDFDRAIVVTANAPARIAPASAAATLFALKAGEPVTAAKTHGQFILIRTSDGRSGWVNRNEIGRVFNAQPGDAKSV
jgi:tetratricopeptide (TPR) repeat protein